MVYSVGCDRTDTASTSTGTQDFVAVQRIIAAQLNITPDAVQPTRTFHDLGADELDIVEITMEVEDTLGITISDDAIDHAVGVQRLEELPKRLTVSAFVEIVTQSPKGP